MRVPGPANPALAILRGGLLGAALCGLLYPLLVFGQLRLRGAVPAALVGLVAGAFVASIVVTPSRRRRGEDDDPERSERLPEFDAWALEREEERARAGDVRAMRRAGEALVRGIGCEADHTAGLAWLRRGAELGDLRCIRAFVRELDVVLPHKATPGTREEALTWARKLAERDEDPESMILLGMLLWDTSVAGADPAEAVQWFLRAAEEGAEQAMISLGWALERGLGCAKAPTQALRWYRRAALAGHATAMVYMASLLERGLTGPPNLEAARLWYQRAASLREPMGEVAALDLAEAEEGRRTVAQDQGIAHQVLSEAALEDGAPRAAKEHAERALECALDPLEVARARRQLARALEADGDYERALEERRRTAQDALLAREGDPFWWIELARLEFLIGDREAALVAVREYVRQGDAVYGWLYVAGLGGDGAALDAFRDPDVWTHRLARFMRDELTPDALLSEACDSRWSPARDGNEVERLCEAHGWIALRADRDGDLLAARRAYEACLATGAAHFAEYEWARLRLEQIERDGSPLLRPAPEAVSPPT